MSWGYLLGSQGIFGMSSWHSLKVFVQLEAVITTVGYHYVTVQGQGQPLRSIQRTGQSVDKGEERALAVKDLDAWVAPIRH